MSLPKIQNEHPYSYAGPGLHIVRMCGKCQSKTSHGGGAYRLVRGARQYICAACKQKIDEVKK